jgi:DNA-binding NtrC family response regulator
MDSAPRILIVDDDASICLAYSEVLTGVGYEVLTANSRADAMAVLDIVGDTVDVLVLDIRLPDADGSEVARDIADRIGQRPTLYVSGWTEDFWDLAEAPGRWRVRQKPIPIPWLLDTVKWLAGGGQEPPPDDR